MGLLRLLLAVAVVLQHSPYRPGAFFNVYIVPGDMAVHAFFIISGFYMAMVLNEKYTMERCWKVFMAARVMRLYPVYLIVLFATVAFFPIISAAEANPIYVRFAIESWASFDWPAKILVALENLTIVGSDFPIGIIQVIDGKLFFEYPADYSLERPNIGIFMLIAPAWSLSTELLFYMLAPFIVRRPLAHVWGLTSLAFAWRIALNMMDVPADPYIVANLPGNLCLFLSGVLAYRHRHLLIRMVGPAAPTALGMMAAATVVAGNVMRFAPATEDKVRWAYFLLVALLTPSLFAATKSSRLDRILGDMSYPLYVSHSLVVALMYCWIGAPPLFVPYTVGMTLVVALALELAVGRPVEHWRQRRIQSLDRRARAQAMAA